MANTDELEKQAAWALRLSSELPDEAKLTEIVRGLAIGLGVIPTNNGPYSETEISETVKLLNTKFDLTMSSGTMFNEDYVPWLLDKQEEIDPYYWSRYEQHLILNKGFSPTIVTKLDQITFDILDRLEDPTKEGQWNKRGMVVGHVQSGKTANYTGLICKAADAGYKVIIVLAGLLNSLRNQTQERIDSDFMGWCTRTKENIGASHFDEKKLPPVCFTTSREDFKKQTANSIAMGLDALNRPVVFVLKKNKSSLENLHNWLTEHNKHNLKDFPMLMVDDEADHASVNTNKKDKDPTTINKSIRDILSIFERSSYVGYTATPFANIFIDPDNEDEMKNGLIYKDLFPRNFILSLDAPPNYIGPSKIFSETSDLDCLRSIDDNLDLLPIKHKIDFEPLVLPESMLQALNCYILARAVRILRGQKDKHTSMMINVSRFTRVQDILLTVVLDKVSQLKQAIGNYSALSVTEALKNTLIKAVHTTWNNEYSHLEFNWDLIQKTLKEAIARLEVICVNSTSDSKLDYSYVANPRGRNVIAIGGLGLSRGLTLEGLMVSYFLRNSIMYDTLMQMGRWFGYRDGYADVCRIYMTDDAIAWYSHIAEATEELRYDFTEMKRSDLTPLQFGLKVKSHPAALIVTARNKMREGVTVPHRISLEGRLVETLALCDSEKVSEKNRSLINTIIEAANKKNTPEHISLGYLWQDVETSIIKYFVENFINHQMSFYTYYYKALHDHLDSTLQAEEGCDILLKTLKPSKDDPYLCVGKGLRGRIQRRDKTAAIQNGAISFKKNSRLGESIDESAGLPSSVIENLKNKSEGGTINPKLYRSAPNKKPLLIIHLIELKNEQLIYGYGLSFPGETTSRRPQKLVEYVVNIPYWKNTFADVLNEEEEGD